ncbi:MAG: hypothetical protein R3D62_09860 [Xanthobacteraceae bacterium]
MSISVSPTAEALEYLLVVFPGDADAVVGDIDAQSTGFRPRRDDDEPVVAIAELHRVGNQIDQHLGQPIGTTNTRGRSSAMRVSRPDARVLSQRGPPLPRARRQS